VGEMMLDVVSVEQSRRLAAEHLEGLGDRWAHVRAVGALAEGLVTAAEVPEIVAAGAWLHDLGYAWDIAESGFHALDGAEFLARAGAPASLVALVAHHSGARFEAAERGLTRRWERLPEPPPEELDALTLVDLVVSPSGAFTTPADRLAEVLQRYSESDPVHRAVRRSQGLLLQAAARARARLGLPDVWPVSTGERVG
jgi:hypothetical protein